MGHWCLSVLLALVAATSALAFAGGANASQSCASKLLGDWRDGRIDGTYPVACYRQALAELPEDARVYSSATADITRALQARLAATAPSHQVTNSGSSRVSPLLLVG